MSLAGTIVIGTRASQLARWQSDHVSAVLQAAWPGLACRIVPFTTEGDRTLDRPLPAIGGKGLFTAELEHALRSGEIDIAVHSLKDLPVEDPPGLTVGAILGRADVRDVLISRDGSTVATLPQGAVVGTSSLRRQAQLLAQRPDLDVRSIRGNVETRLRKVREGDYDATILAAAGLERLGLAQGQGEPLSLADMLPAPGQGALAVQCRADDARVLKILAAINQETVRVAVTAERAFLHALGGGCAVPVAAYAYPENGAWRLDGLVADPSGAPLIRVSAGGSDPLALGRDLAQQAGLAGADYVLDRVKPLRGRRIVVTRSAEQARAFAGDLSALGAEAIIFPVITFVRLESPQLTGALADLPAYAWLVFTSANAVRYFFEVYDAQEQPLPLPRIAAVGQATGELLAARGLTPDFVPDVFTGAELAAGLGDLTGQRVLLPRARIGRPEIVEILQAQGAAVDDIALYDTVTAVPTDESLAELRRGADVVTFTSPSSVRNFRQVLSSAGLDPDAFLAGALTLCIGPSTADQLEEFGRAADLVPATYTIDGMIAALVDHLAAR